MTLRPLRLAATAVTGAVLGLAVGMLPALHGTAAAATTPNPPALWYKIAGSISDAEAVAAASRYRVVILQSWQTAAAKRIKSLNPSVTVLAYKDLSCADEKPAALDNERNGRPMATGVGYLEAEANGWFALDTAGQRVNWEDYPNLWQLEVWNPAYQQRWVDKVVAEMRNSVWDGVFGDDALTTLRYYSDRTLAEAPTDAALQAGMEALLTKAAAGLHGIGKKLVVNISGATDNIPVWTKWTGIADGGMLEHYAHWGSNPDSASNYLWDWGSSGWRAGATALGTSKLNVAVTTSADTDDRSYRYGLASFLIATGGHGAFTAVDSYAKAAFRPEQAWDLGIATVARQQTGPIHHRTFPRGFAAVNASKDRTATIPVPAGLVDVTGKPVTSLTLPPLTGAVLKGVTVTRKSWRHHAPAPIAVPPAQPAPVTAPAATAPAAPAAPAPAVPAVRRPARTTATGPGTAGRPARVGSGPAPAAPVVPADPRPRAAQDVVEATAASVATARRTPVARAATVRSATIRSATIRSAAVPATPSRPVDTPTVGLAVLLVAGTAVARHRTDG